MNWKNKMDAQIYNFGLSVHNKICNVAFHASSTVRV